MTDDIKSRLRERSKMTKKYYKYGQVKSYLDELQEKTDECTTLIFDPKEKYVGCMSNKLNDPLTAPKVYWSVLSRFLNQGCQHFFRLNFKVFKAIENISKVLMCKFKVFFT